MKMSNARYQSLFAYGMAQGRRQYQAQSAPAKPMKARQEAKASLFERLNKLLFKS